MSTLSRRWFFGIAAMAPAVAISPARAAQAVAVDGAWEIGIGEAPRATFFDAASARRNVDSARFSFAEVCRVFRMDPDDVTVLDGPYGDLLRKAMGDFVSADPTDDWEPV